MVFSKVCMFSSCHIAPFAVGTPYEGGAFRVKLVLTREYPAAPPKGELSCVRKGIQDQWQSSTLMEGALPLEMGFTEDGHTTNASPAPPPLLQATS